MIKKIIFAAVIILNVLSIVTASAKGETSPTRLAESKRVGGGNMQTNVEYGKGGDETLLLDVNVPDGNGPFSAAVIVHGGGWAGGDKQGVEKVLFEPLTEAKIVWFSINYRLAPKNKWPACLDDVKTAIKWVKVNAAKYKVDPNRVALFGYSAGGQIACQAGVTADKDTAVAAIVGLAAPTDLVFDSLRRGNISTYLTGLFGFGADDVNSPKAVQVLWEASPINHIKAGLPPVLLVAGTADKSVPYQLSLNFKNRLDAFGVPCEMITINGASHKIVEWNKFDADFTKKIVDWLNKILNSHKDTKTLK